MKTGKNTISASILGASGYSGAMALRILLHHPGVTVDKVFAESSVGEPVAKLYPSMRGMTNLVYEKYSLDLVSNSDLIFLALPAAHAMKIVPELLSAGKRVIDLSGDYRLKDISEYLEYYHTEHTSEPELKVACYGLPELNRKFISDAQLLSNPGCYATGAIIPLAPLLNTGLISEADISISSLSGVSGAGRKASIDLSFAEVDGSVKAYRVGNHQHIPEIQNVLATHSGKDVVVRFVPHLLPSVRGIYSTIFVKPVGGVSESMLNDAFIHEYSDEPFVRLLGGELPEIKSVVGSNYIDVAWRYDARTRTVILFSAIDNLMKGAAGQAVQNMNIMYGFQEKEALIS